MNATISCSSLIDTDNTTKFLNNMVSKSGLGYQLEHKDAQEICFNLTNQVTLQVGPDANSILGDGNSDAATINANCSAPTLSTTKSFLNPPINYLDPPISST